MRSAGQPNGQPREAQAAGLELQRPPALVYIRDCLTTKFLTIHGCSIRLTAQRLRANMVIVIEHNLDDQDIGLTDDQPSGGARNRCRLLEDVAAVPGEPPGFAEVAWRRRAAIAAEQTAQRQLAVDYRCASSLCHGGELRGLTHRVSGARKTNQDSAVPSCHGIITPNTSF